VIPLWKYVIVLMGFYVLQMYMAYRQMQHFKRTILDLRDQGVMGLGVKKSKLGQGRVVVLVSNPEGEISVARVMSGISVFARFREKKDLCGMHVDQLIALNSGKGKEQAAIREALLQIQQKLTVPLPAVQ